MEHTDDSEGDSSSDSRELGVEFGPLKSELENHDYPATGEQLVAEYGDYELDLPGGSQTFGEVLGKRQRADDGAETVEYDSPDEVQQTVLNMVGSEAVGREGYSDRGGSLTSELAEGDDQQDDTM